MAPFTPFFTEHMFQNLRKLLPWRLSDDNASLHYIMFPKPKYVCGWIVVKRICCLPAYIVLPYLGKRPLVNISV